MIKKSSILITLIIYFIGIIHLEAQSVEIGGFLKLENVSENLNASNFLTINSNGEVEKVPISNLLSLPSGMILLSEKIDDNVLTSNGFSMIGATIIQIQDKGLNNVNYGEWTSTSLEGTLSARTYASSLWTGSEAVIIGGYDGTHLSDGGRYNPTTKNWTKMSNVNGPTGIILSAILVNDNIYVFYYQGNPSIPSMKKYSLSTDTWINVSMTNGPSDFSGTLKVGNSIINVIPNSEGKKFDIATETWSNISIINSPSIRRDQITLWTGTEYIIWGGRDLQGQTYFNDGSAYNPVNNTWRTLPTTSLSGRILSHAFWTGSEMIIWSGTDGSIYTNDGAKYNPATNTWSSMASITNSVAGVAANWIGNGIIVTDPYSSSKCIKYDYASNQWSDLNNLNMPPRGLGGFTTLTMGNKQLIWGGLYDNFTTFEGYIFDSSKKGYLSTKNNKYYIYKKA